MVERLDLRFPTQEEGVFEREVVIFCGQDGETRLRCKTSRGALVR